MKCNGLALSFIVYPMQQPSYIGTDIPSYIVTWYLMKSVLLPYGRKLTFPEPIFTHFNF